MRLGRHAPLGRLRGVHISGDKTECEVWAHQTGMSCRAAVPMRRRERAELELPQPTEMRGRGHGWGGTKTYYS